MVGYTNSEKTLYTYGGLACNKVGVTKDGVDYMIKFPGGLHHLDKVDLSYANDVISEYIASAVMRMYMPAHNVSLGLYRDKVCAVCTDFVGEYGRIIPYSELKTTLENPLLDKSGDVSNGLSPEIDEIDYVLDNSPVARKVPDAHRQFWKMFIIDALNGNPDRNNGNWGLLRKHGKITFCPVYDNGNSLNSKWSDERLTDAISDSKRMQTLAYKGIVCFFKQDDCKINPFQYIASGESKYISEVLGGLDFSENRYGAVCAVVDSVPDMPEIRNRFIKEIYKLRFEELRRLQEDLC